MVAPASGWAKPIVVFGDSLSDTGNASIATGGLIPPSPPYFDGRFSNGPIYVDRLAQALGGSVEPALAGGTNFAVGGATADVSFVPPGLRTQTDLFIADLPSSGADPDALYVVFGGGNDLIAATGRSDSGTFAMDTASEVASAVADLTAAGAEDFLILNLPNLGRVPTVREGGPDAAATGTALSLAFNDSLQTRLAEVERNSAAEIAPVNVFGLLEAVVADPAAFGLTDVTAPCLTGEPFDVADDPLDLIGGADPDVSVCGDPDRHLFWDERHPTAAGHALLADAALAALGNGGSDGNGSGGSGAPPGGDAVAVPEPRPLALIALALAVLLIWRSPRRILPETAPSRRG